MPKCALVIKLTYTMIGWTRTARQILLSIFAFLILAINKWSYKYLDIYATKSEINSLLTLTQSLFDFLLAAVSYFSHSIRAFRKSLVPASYPDVSLSMKMSLSVHHQSLAFRARLYDATNEAPEEEAGLVRWQERHSVKSSLFNGTGYTRPFPISTNREIVWVGFPLGFDNLVCEYISYPKG